MKIAPKAAASLLAKPNQPYHALLLYGPDAGLARERMQLVAKNLNIDANDPFSTLELSESKLLADPVQLTDELSGYSFMASQRLMIIRDAGDKLTKVLEATVDTLRADYFLVVIAGELGPRSSLRSWFEKTPSVAALACYQDDARDVQEVIRAHFANEQVQAPSDVVQYIASQLGNDRYVTRQELEKISLYLGGQKRLTMQDAQQLVDYNRDASTDDLVNAVADKSLRQLDEELGRLLREGVKPVQYLRALSRYFQRLYALKLQAEHSSIESVIAAQRPPVFFKQVPILTRHVREWSLPNIAKALKLITSAELACKTSDMPAVAMSERKLMQLTQLR